MLPFSTLLLRSYYAAIGWNEDNLYSNITRSSAALLDFPIPDSLILQLANAPTPIFFTSYALDALPQLNGSMSYITTSAPLTGIGPSRSMAFRDVVERFRVYPQPKRPVGKDEVWLGGRRIEGRDYLLYSRLHFPTMHLSGLATTRLTPTLQAHIAFVHQPTAPRPLSAPLPHHHLAASSSSHTRQPSDSSVPPVAAPATPGNVLISLQHDTGRYSGEYTYSAQDGMFGWRSLYNFGWRQDVSAAAATAVDKQSPREGDERKGRRIDEEEMMDGGLRGRFSAGGEVYFSAMQRSFGISTGVRFTTLPPAVGPGAPPPSPPTTLTLLYNPLIGFLSTAYSAQVSPTVALSTRFGVNVYSYESDFAIGGEWWIGRRRGKRGPEFVPSPEEAEMLAKHATLRGALRADPGPELDSASTLTPTPTPAPVPRYDEQAGEHERDGVLKARMSGNWSIALLYESRIRNCLVSVGLISDVLSGNSGKAIRSVGLEVQYFS